MDPFIGEIRMLGFDYAPKGWAFCDGQTLAISQFQALFSLIGTTYGGDGRTTFQLPNLQGCIPLHAVGGTYPLGKRGGEEFHALTERELPAHTHNATASSNAADQVSPENNFWAAAAGKNLYAPAANANMAGAALQPSGNNGHENRPPFQVVNFCIALDGIFPSRP